jgi:hypothetical protein
MIAMRLPRFCSCSPWSDHGQPVVGRPTCLQQKHTPPLAPAGCPIGGVEASAYFLVMMIVLPGSDLRFCLPSEEDAFYRELDSVSVVAAAAFGAILVTAS